MSTYRQQLGADGEERAASWYAAAGYVVLDRNWRWRHGEIDLVVRRGSTIAFCEVKTRRTSSFGQPADAVTARKQARLRRAAAYWLCARGTHLAGPDVREVRFDVAAVTGTRVSVIEDAW